MKIVLVTWYDAYTFDEWYSKGEIISRINDQPKGAVTISPGILFEETEDKIVLVQSLQPETNITEADYAGIIVIPRGMIIGEVEVLKEL